MYGAGEGVEENIAEATKWLKKAAEQGHAEAQYALGMMYKEGYGVEKDLTEATKWLKKAAVQGFDVANEELAKL